MPENTLFSYRTPEAGKTLFDPRNPLWEKCETATIDRYWNGKSALREKGYNWANLTHVRSLWNEEHVYFYFESWFDSLNINSDWGTESATEGLWNKDVVEVFLRPGTAASYFEIEASPLGQWMDLEILKPREEVDLTWNSDLELETVLNEHECIWRAFLGLPYQSMKELPPEVGQAWRVNLCRIAGKEPDREYLAWRPTFTGQPDFHKPSSFGHLIFLDD